VRSFYYNEISESKRITTMMRTFDVALVPHSPPGPTALATCLQEAACYPNYVIQEMSLNIYYNARGYDFLKHVLNKEVFEVKEDDWLDVPMGNTIGLEMDRIWFARQPKKIA
jgi:galactonate dehydratase